MNVQLCQKLLPLLAIPAVMLKGALPLFSPLGDGPFTAGMGYIGIRHALWPLQSMFQSLNSVNSASFNVQIELKEYWSS